MSTPSPERRREVIGHSIKRLSGARVVVLDWRDIRHPQAGGAEQFMHQIARRWAAAGAQVSWLAAGPAGLARREVVDGVCIHRAGGPLSLYARTALRLMRMQGRIDYIVDCQNGIPFFAPLFVAPTVPVLQVVHHVHQDQFATRFGPALAAIGRFLEGTAARWVYGQRPLVAVSPSTRQELRRRLRFRAPIHIVPNGSAAVPTARATRDPDPTIALVSRLVPHKRVDLLLENLVRVAEAIPRLRVDVVGDGSELQRLRRLADELGLARVVSFHGFQPDAVRDDLLNRAWLTAVTSAGEGWGCSVIEAARLGVPTVALRVPGIRDSVVDGQTGWLVDEKGDLAAVLTAALHELADDDRARHVTEVCQAWARCFDWNRSAALLAGALLDAAAHSAGQSRARSARSDIATVVCFPRPTAWPPAEQLPSAALRPTDQVIVDEGQVHLLLPGCDEVDAVTVLARLGISGASVRLADRHDLLAGPAGLPAVLTNAVVDHSEPAKPGAIGSLGEIAAP